MKLRIQIDVTNPAFFNNDQEISNILTNLAEHFKGCRGFDQHEADIVASNGEVVGYARIIKTGYETKESW